MVRTLRPVATVHRTDVIGELDALLIRMFALVTEGVAAASEAFLAGDRDIARRVIADDRRIDELQVQVEELVEDRLAGPDPLDAHEVRLLVSVLRIAPELERSGDLIEHIALRTTQRLTAGLTPRARGLLADMAAMASTLWLGATDAYVDRDAGRVDRLRLQDDTLDDLHVELTAELSHGQTSIAEAVELGLVARFYERLGDHAVNVARRIGYLIDG